MAAEMVFPAFRCSYKFLQVYTVRGAPLQAFKFTPLFTTNAVSQRCYSSSFGSSRHVLESRAAFPKVADTRLHHVRCLFHSAHQLSGDAPSIGTRMLKFIGRIGGFDSNYQVLMRSVKKLYESCIDNIDYENFFKVCSLPNTLQSWFLVAHLHIWLCVVQLDRLGTKDAKIAKRILANMFWNDVEERIKALGASSGRNLTSSKRELVSQFYGLTKAYYEGLQQMPDGTKMQSSLVRNMTSDVKEQNGAAIGKHLLDYVDSQLEALKSVPIEDLKETGVVLWKPLHLKTEVTG